MKKAVLIFNWLLVIIWIGVIFYFSSLPDLKSTLPSFWDLIFRKIAHISEYFVLTYFFIRAFLGHKIDKNNALILSVVLAIIYSISDEYHQTLIVGRSGRMEDVLIDSVGVMLMIWLWSKKSTQSGLDQILKKFKIT